MLLTSADVAYLGRGSKAHILNYMYKNKEKEELLDITNVDPKLPLSSKRFFEKIQKQSFIPQCYFIEFVTCKTLET